MKNWFFALLKKGEGWFTTSYSLEMELWAYCVILLAFFLAGVWVGWK